MTKQELINQTLSYLQGLPDNKVVEIADFTEYVYHKYEEMVLRGGMQTLSASTAALEFLHHEEDLYTIDDLKERYK